MSKWHEVIDNDNVGISEDGEKLQVKFDTDHDGNVWVEIPLNFIESETLNKLAEFVLMEQLSRRNYSASKMCEVIHGEIQKLKI